MNKLEFPLLTNHLHVYVIWLNYVLQGIFNQSINQSRTLVDIDPFILLSNILNSSMYTVFSIFRDPLSLEKKIVLYLIKLESPSFEQT